VKFSKEFLDKVVAGSGPECREIKPVIHKCAMAGAAKCKAMIHADDIEQELWCFLVKNVARLDSAYNIEPYLIETARNIALSYNRKYAFHGTEGIDEALEIGISDLGGGTVASAEEAIDGMIEGVSQDQAMDYLLQRSASLRCAANQSFDDYGEDGMKSAPNNGTTARSRARTIAPDQQELRSIRMKCGFGQFEMAQALGVKLATLQAYEYGKTHTVNEDVMIRARALLKDTDFTYMQALFHGRSMAAIANEWAKRLGVRKGDISGLARMIGVNKSTVSRWFNTEERSRPNTWELVRYEAIVCRQEQLLHEAAEASEKLN
jgi:DNA-binding transcriptional regulator YiaG